MSPARRFWRWPSRDCHPRYGVAKPVGLPRSAANKCTRAPDARRIGALVPYLTVGVLNEEVAPTGSGFFEDTPAVRF